MTKIDWDSIEESSVEELFESGYEEKTRVKIRDVPTNVSTIGRHGNLHDRLDFFVMMHGKLPCISSSIRYNKEYRAWALHLKQRENKQEVVLGGDFHPKPPFLEISYIDVPELQRAFEHEDEKKGYWQRQFSPPKQFTGVPTTLILQKPYWENELHFNLMLDGTLPCLGNKFDYYKDKTRIFALYLEEIIGTGRKIDVVGRPYSDKRPQYLVLKQIGIPDTGIEITTSRF